MSVSANITGSAKLVITHLQGLPNAIDQALVSGLARGLLYAVGLSQRSYLSGPRPAVLEVRTRRLRNAVASEVEIDRTVIALERGRTATLTQRTSGTGNIIGRLGNNVAYAAFHEYGFHGVINVAAHQRIVSTLDVTGKKVDLRRKQFDKQGVYIGLRENHARALDRNPNRAAFIFTQNVRAHRREINYNGRPFIRPALEKSLPVISREIKKELDAL
jgi:hypothetical protein